MDWQDYLWLEIYLRHLNSIMTYNEMMRIRKNVKLNRTNLNEEEKIQQHNQRKFDDIYIRYYIGYGYSYSRIADDYRLEFFVVWNLFI